MTRTLHQDRPVSRRSGSGISTLRQCGCAIALAVGLTAPVALAGSGTFEITWYTIDGGGGVSGGGGFVLSGTIGQPDAGSASGGNFALAGGFWGGAADPAPPCPADLSGDGIVNSTDLLELLNAWGTCPPPCPADLNNDEVVNSTDLLMLLNSWGPCP